MITNSAINRRLDLINEMALHDELYEDIPDDLLERFSLWSLHTLDADNITIHSFDIDLTLALPEDVAWGCTGLIPLAEPIRLQREGVIVGTCSDRDPSNQRETMRALGFKPDFCIPKEMLSALKQLIPAEKTVHYGDSETRDRDMAEKANWTHVWPWDYDLGE